MQLAQAKTIAEGLVEAFKPYCRRVQIAGSIRRERPEVKDIEIVAVPHMRFGEDLFGNPGEPYSVLDDALLKMLQAGWGEQKKGGDRYKQIWLTREQIFLDLFTVLPPAQWGVIYAIRTGPSDFSQWLVTPRRKGGALPAHLVIHDGAAWEDLNRPIETPEEVDFFKALELSWIEPGKRVAGWRKTGMAR